MAEVTKRSCKLCGQPIEVYRLPAGGLVACDPGPLDWAAPGLRRLQHEGQTLGLDGNGLAFNFSLGGYGENPAGFIRAKWFRQHRASCAQFNGGKNGR